MYQDISKISYNSMVGRTKMLAPYRGSDGAYPLGHRRYPPRHFRMRGDLIDIYHTWISDSMKTLARPTPETGCIMTIHPDNSFELRSCRGNGDSGLISALTRANIHYSVRHGGRVYCGRKTHPLFRGIRINLDTGDAAVPYKFYKRSINKREAARVLEPYKTFKDVTGKLIGAMTVKGVAETYTDLRGMFNEVGAANTESFIRLVQEGKYVDAAIVLYALPTSSRSYPIHFPDFLLKNPKFFERYITRLIGQLSNNTDTAILSFDDSAMNIEELPVGEIFSTSKWGYILTDINGNKLNRL